MFRVLIPSLCITNPLTLNHSLLFWVIHSFPIPLETIKFHGDYYLICASQINPMVLSQHFYRYTLLEIFGVTSTKLTFPVAFAYLEHEREENFTCQLEKLKELFSPVKFLLKDIVRDRELVLMNSMGSEFPSATHLLCTFHISKNVSMKCKEHVKSKRQEHLMELWNEIM